MVDLLGVSHKEDTSAHVITIINDIYTTLKELTHYCTLQS